MNKKETPHGGIVVAAHPIKHVFQKKIVNGRVVDVGEYIEGGENDKMQARIEQRLRNLGLR